MSAETLMEGMHHNAVSCDSCRDDAEAVRDALLAAVEEGEG